MGHVVLARGWEGTGRMRKLTVCARSFCAGLQGAILPSGGELSLTFAFGRAGVESQVWHFPAV